MLIFFHLLRAGFKLYMASVQFLMGTGPCSKTTTHVGTIPKQLVLCGQKWDKIGSEGARGQDAGALWDTHKSPKICMCVSHT